MMTRSGAAVDAKKTRPGKFALSAVDVAGGLAFLLVLLVILLRLNKGADFGDESYYALFVDDWLKGGIGSSTYLVVHQTAALLVFPFAWLYVHVTGSTDGLFLGLRYLYLLGSVLASAAVIVLLRRLGLGARSWSAGLLILAFIPFGLPAPSYNTIGLQALCVALSAFGCGVQAVRRHATDAWFATSAGAWSVAVIAYPPLVLAACLMAVLLLMHRHDPKLPAWRYLVMLVAAQIVAWTLVAWIVSMSRLSMSLEYTSGTTTAGGLPAKLGRGVDLMVNNSWFALLCIAAVAVGLARRRLSFTVATAAVVSLVALSFIQPPALFVRSHDVVTLVALTGVGLVCGLRQTADPIARLLGILYTVSIASGLTTMFFATNLLFNFCLGASFAAALAITGPNSGGNNKRDLVAAATGLCVIGAILSTSLRSFYGDSTTSHQVRHLIAEGFFAGIQAGPDDIQLLEIVRDRVTPLVQQGQPWLVYIGRNPGVMLVTPARLRMLTSSPLVAPVAAKGFARVVEFYSSPNNRPMTVIIYRDPLVYPVNPMGPRFREWYTLLRTEKTPLGVLEIYRRR